jgi:hypothetical protein
VSQLPSQLSSQLKIPAQSQPELHHELQLESHDPSQEVQGVCASLRARMQRQYVSKRRGQAASGAGRADQP